MCYACLVHCSIAILTCSSRHCTSKAVKYKKWSKEPVSRIPVMWEIT